jgi:transposase
MVVTLSGMSQRFIDCDREQDFLLPPSVLEWVPADHLVWTIIESVAELALSEFYASYRWDGRGRPAYDPQMMVTLLCYSYSRGIRSSRGIERACVEDVVFRVIAANRVPDHSTIAEFRVRHEEALAELFGGVLELCKNAGLASVGVIAVDGTKVHANASSYSNADYQRIATEIFKEADRIDREEDELYGDARGDELPEQLRTPEGRRAALKAAKEKLERERQRQREQRDRPRGEQPLPAEQPTEPAEEPGGEGRLFCLKLDAGEIVAGQNGREGWLRAARHQLDRHREQNQQPVPRSRVERLLEAERRLVQDLAVEHQANQAYEAYRKAGVMKDGRRFGGPPKPYVPPQEPEGKINLTDPDCRLQKVRQGWVQGYNAQAVVNEHQIVLAAEITLDSPDFGHLGPMIEATERQLAKAGITERPEVVLADAGYWHQAQMQQITSRGMQVLVPPDSRNRKGERAGWSGGMYSWMRQILSHEPGKGLYRKRPGMIEPVFADEKFNRGVDRFQRRGEAAALSEWRLVNATHNLLKLHRHRISPATG